ncbi:MAG: hypothetical protein AB7U73_03395 [Pirellulales bacterium]
MSRRRANFLRLSSRRFVVISMALIALNLAAVACWPAWHALVDVLFDYLRRPNFLGIPLAQFILGTLYDGSLFLAVSCQVFWSLAQQRVSFIMRTMVAVLLGTSLSFTWRACNTVSSFLDRWEYWFFGSFFATTAAMLLLWMHCRGWRLVPTNRLFTHVRRRLQISLLELMVILVAVSAWFAGLLLMRHFRFEAESSREFPSAYWIFEQSFVDGSVCAAIAVGVLFSSLAFVGPKRCVIGLLVALAAHTALVTIRNPSELSNWEWELMARTRLLLYDVAIIGALAAVLLAIRRIYGLRLVSSTRGSRGPALGRLTGRACQR